MQAMSTPSNLTDHITHSILPLASEWRSSEFHVWSAKETRNHCGNHVIPTTGATTGLMAGLSKISIQSTDPFLGMARDRPMTVILMVHSKSTRQIIIYYNRKRSWRCAPTTKSTQIQRALQRDFKPRGVKLPRSEGWVNPSAYFGFPHQISATEGAVLDDAKFGSLRPKKLLLQRNNRVSNMIVEGDSVVKSVKSEEKMWLDITLFTVSQVDLSKEMSRVVKWCHYPIFFQCAPNLVTPSKNKKWQWKILW